MVHCSSAARRARVLNRAWGPSVARCRPPPHSPLEPNFSHRCFCPALRTAATTDVVSWSPATEQVCAPLAACIWLRGVALALWAPGSARTAPTQPLLLQAWSAEQQVEPAARARAYHTSSVVAATRTVTARGARAAPACGASLDGAPQAAGREAVALAAGPAAPVRAGRRPVPPWPVLLEATCGPTTYPNTHRSRACTHCGCRLMAAGALAHHFQSGVAQVASVLSKI
jgi:hypothetical protein